MERIKIELGRMEAQQVREALAYYAGQMTLLHPGDQAAYNQSYVLHDVCDRIHKALESEVSSNE